MNTDFTLPRAYANAYPYHPKFFPELREAIVRTAYHAIFAPILPAGLVPKFRDYAGTAGLRELTHAVVSHVVMYPHRANV